MNRIDGSGKKEIMGSIRTSERVSRDATPPARASKRRRPLSSRKSPFESVVAKVTVRK